MSAEVPAKMSIRRDPMRWKRRSSDHTAKWVSGDVTGGSSRDNVLRKRTVSSKEVNRDRYI